MNEKDYKRSTILVDVDSLLDTRASLLLRHDPDGFEGMLLSGYHSREADDFINIDLEVFRELYLKRDISLLKNSIATSMINFVNRFISQTLKAAMNSPYVTRPKVDINFYPYELSGEDMNMFIQVVAAKTKGLADIEGISIAPNKLTPSLVKEKYVQLIMYHWLDWIALPEFTEEFNKGILKDRMLIAPYLLKDSASARSLKKEETLSQTELYYSPIIKLKLIDASYFSFAIRKPAQPAQPLAT